VEAQVTFDRPAVVPDSTAEISIRTDPVAHEEFATWLVGSRGPLGGVGGESEAFEEQVVRLAESIEPIARGTDTQLREGNWFRRVSVAQTQAMVKFAQETRLGLSALGNAAGSIGDAYDKTDRQAARLFEAAADDLADFATSTEPGAIPGEPPATGPGYVVPAAGTPPTMIV
jgi:hypothetical protein